MKVIKVKVQNGLSYQNLIEQIILEMPSDFILEESNDNPELIIFGPYGIDIPKKGNYLRVGYFCENITPDLSCCEWAFGIPREEEINHPNYKRIQWHGLNPEVLIKNIDDNEIDRIFETKTKFCNFLYSHKVPYREEFFKQLSKYKKIDAPGKSMNNMPSIDQICKGNIWERKRQFLKNYKFTIAFENYVYPGYQTEKLYDAMQCNSIPIYCGDPYIHEVFNTKSFINAGDFLIENKNIAVPFLEKYAQLKFIDILPQYYKNPKNRIQRKLKDWGRKLKMRLQYQKLDFSPVIDEIIKVDRNPQFYKDMLKKSWFVNNQVPERLSTYKQWEKIFNSL